MKQLTSSIFALLISILCSAQPNSFFGLSFGEVYTQEQMIAAVGDKGSFMGLVENLGASESVLGLDSYYFSNVLYEGRSFPVMAFQFAPTSGKLLAVSFAFVADEETDANLLNLKYAEIDGWLNKQYPMSSVDLGDSSIIRKVYQNMFGTTVRFDKVFDSGKVTSVELMFMDTLGTAVEVLGQMPERPEIQNSFFGMTMGEKYTYSQVKEAIGGRGTYDNLERQSYGTECTFRNVSFAGETWDFAVVTRTDDGRFYMLRVYDSRLNTYNDRKDLESLFGILKKKLDDKYGSVEIDEEDGDLTATYLGSNAMGVVLKNETSRSKGGTYRRYLQITYVQRDIFDEILETSDDEL